MKANFYVATKAAQVVLTSGTSNSPAVILSIISCGCDPSTVHPTDWHVPVMNNYQQTTNNGNVIKKDKATFYVYW